MTGISPVFQVHIGRVENGTACLAEDSVAVEEPLEIRLGGRSFSVTMRTPGNDLELAAGFLLSEGIIRSGAGIRSLRSHPDDSNIVEVELTDERPRVAPVARDLLVTSACGVCGKASLDELGANPCPVLPPGSLRIHPSAISQLPERIRQAQCIFETTGGLHAAALFTAEGELLSLREDVGRHNAVDKLTGAALLEDRVPLSDCVMLVSGRASFELVQKGLAAGIPVLCAVGAPSSLAVETARRSGMTLIGFLRAQRFNIYTHSSRVRGMEAFQ